ncbi:MAG: hypothetical protein IKA31_00150, partial [Clostridia bacterium]|nr:hypothetical protein [Clostridia bacterium]
MEEIEAKWYVLHTFSGYEQVAKTNLEIVVKKYNLEERIFDIIIPMEETIEERNGKKISTLVLARSIRLCRRDHRRIHIDRIRSLY